MLSRSERDAIRNAGNKLKLPDGKYQGWVSRVEEYKGGNDKTSILVTFELLNNDGEKVHRADYLHIRSGNPVARQINQARLNELIDAAGKDIETIDLGRDLPGAKVLVVIKNRMSKEGKEYQDIVNYLPCRTPGDAPAR